MSSSSVLRRPSGGRDQEDGDQRDRGPESDPGAQMAGQVLGPHSTVRRRGRLVAGIHARCDATDIQGEGQASEDDDGEDDERNRDELTLAFSPVDACHRSGPAVR